MPDSSASPHDKLDHESVNQHSSPSNGDFLEGHIHPGEVSLPIAALEETAHDRKKKAQQESGSKSSSSPRKDSATAAPSSKLDKISDQQDRENYQESNNEYGQLISYAPPAYSPPQSSNHQGPHAGNVNPAGGYGTSGTSQSLLFPTTIDGREGETAPLLQNQRDRKNWSHRLNKWWDKNSYKRLKYIVLVLAIMSALYMMGAIALDLYEKSNRGHWDNDLKSPFTDEIPSTCEFVGSGNFTFEWDKSTRWKIQHIIRSSSTQPSHSRIQNLGKIHIRPASATATKDIKVDVLYYYSSHAVAAELEIVEEDEILKMFNSSVTSS